MGWLAAFGGWLWGAVTTVVVAVFRGVVRGLEAGAEVWVTARFA